MAANRFEVDQRAALFGNRSVGRGRGDDLKAAYTREVMEKQNDDAIGDLEAKVAQLKGITMNIKDETAQSLSFLDTLGAGFEKAGDMLKSTVGNLRSMVHQHGGQSFCTKVMAIVVVVVLMLYLLRNLRSSPETSPP
mmetsp:Transcript_6101/g.14598  ORF Transcript_6101/g.14598 Transcript_6101/m.14598 type:complete len:137 (-) Transcript_6101:34-444(-)